MRTFWLIVAALAAGSSLGCTNEVKTSQQTTGTVAIGQAAPQFTLEDQNGKPVSLKDFSGDVVVLEWTNPECPFVQRHYQRHTMTDLAAKYKGSGVVWLAINSTNGVTDADSKQWADQQQIGYPILNDSSGATGHAYLATNTPQMIVINKDGTVVYDGAIDNDRGGDRTDGKINYVDQALGEVLAGKAVSVPRTTPYGCQVHYAK
jgi:peroxiredoxin